MAFGRMHDRREACANRGDGGDFCEMLRMREQPCPGPPVIRASNQCLFLGAQFDPIADVSAVDWDGSDIPVTQNHVIFNDVDATAAGIYTVTYQVTAPSGLTDVQNIYIGIIDPDPKYQTVSELIQSIVFGERRDR